MQQILDANATLRKLKKVTGYVYIPRVSLEDCCLVAFSDASHANMPGMGSQGGYMLFVANNGVASSDDQAAMVEWSSHRIKRTVRSTLAAEAAALSEAQDRAEHARVVLAEMLGTNISVWSDALKIPCYYVIDANSLYDLLNKQGSLPQERRVALDILAMREALERDSDKLRWVPTRHMLADMLTKRMKMGPYVSHVLSHGRLSLVESPEASHVIQGKKPDGDVYMMEIASDKIEDLMSHREATSTVGHAPSLGREDMSKPGALDKGKKGEREITSKPKEKKMLEEDEEEQY